MAKVIRVKEKSNINNLIIVDCLANILTVLLHMAIHTPLFKLRLAQCFIFISSVAGRSDRSSRSYDATLRVAHHCTGGPPKTNQMFRFLLRTEQNMNNANKGCKARHECISQTNNAVEVFSLPGRAVLFRGCCAALYQLQHMSKHAQWTPNGRANAFFHTFS